MENQTGAISPSEIEKHLSELIENILPSYKLTWGYKIPGAQITIMPIGSNMP
jgi:hypothetical protein